jgi:hypothetical protein
VTHCPSSQTGVSSPQTLPHAPQFDGSVVKLVQTPLQLGKGPHGIALQGSQAPSMQAGVESSQTMPQPPQF